MSSADIAFQKLWTYGVQIDKTNKILFLDKVIEILARFFYVPVFSKDDKNVLFMHIPKTGGSSVTAFFRSRGWVVSYEDRSSLTKPGGTNYLRRISPQHLHAELIEEIYDLEKFDAVFSVVRHPLSRFKSEFAFRNPEVPISEISPKLVEEWSFWALGQYRGNRSWADNHLRPQMDFVTPKSLLFRIENGFSEIEDLESSLNNNRDQTLEKCADFPIANKSRFESDLIPLSPKLKRLLLRFYRTDFQKLNYSRR